MVIRFRTTTTKIITSLFTTPVYDPKTNKIHNCKKGSFNWHHENRHKQQAKNKTLYKIDNYTYILGYYTGMFSLIGYFVSKHILWVFLTFIGWVPHTLYCLWIELDANIYATKQKIIYKK